MISKHKSHHVTNANMAAFVLPKNEDIVVHCQHGGSDNRPYLPLTAPHA